MNKIFLVTGVNGIGKSTVLSHLKDRLLPPEFSIYDFDERGVPNNADKVWRASETIHWFTTAGLSNVPTIVCGFMKYPEIEGACKETKILPEICLLDASDSIIKERLLSRYKTRESLQELERTTGKSVEEFVAGNVWTAKQLREQAHQHAYTIIDTSRLTPEEVCERIIHWLDAMK